MARLVAAYARADVARQDAAWLEGLVQGGATLGVSAAWLHGRGLRAERDSRNLPDLWLELWVHDL